MAPTPPPALKQVKAELIRLRQGQGLARPTAVLGLSGPLRAHLAPGLHTAAGSAEEAARLVTALRHAVGHLAQHERLYAEVDLNLAADHAYSTLTERQASLAQAKKCAAKTVRRHADLALDTLAYLLVTGVPPEGDARHLVATAGAGPGPAGPEDWREELRRFWRLAAGGRIDIVCSEIPEPERPYFADPADRNYLRYAKFADLDSLIYLRTRLAQLAPAATVRDFSPSEYYDTHADVLVVVGGPPWNATYREFLPHLPFYFEPHPLGEDDPLVVPALGGLTLGPRWTERAELVEDLAVFTRLTLAHGTTVFLLGGCLTLGVLGAASCFLEGRRGASSVRYILDQVGQDDFVLVTEARRIGGMTDVADLAAVNPLLLLARRHNDPFAVAVDNTVRYAARRDSAPSR